MTFRRAFAWFFAAVMFLALFVGIFAAIWLWVGPLAGFCCLALIVFLACGSYAITAETAEW